MHKQLMRILACPVCGKSLVFEGKGSDTRFVNGYLKCGQGHLYQIKEEIGLLKDAKISANEFEWKVNVADEKKYDEIRKQYDSYLSKDQKTATHKMMERLTDLVLESSGQSDGMVLDVATGMGTLLLPLAEKSPKNTLIMGTDIDEKPLRGAMNKAKKAGSLPKLSFLVTDAKHFCFKDDVLSTISSHFGFNNIPETALSFKDSARVLRHGGRMIFSSLWLKEGSKSMHMADEHQIGQIVSEKRLRKVLGSADLRLDRVEEAYSGVWPYNPMDLLPVEGDAYEHVVVQVKKP